MKIQMSYICKKNEGTGICVCEGRTDRRRRSNLGYSMDFNKFMGRREILMAVMCRAAAENNVAAGSVAATLAVFQRWFHEELPDLLSRFSFDIVKCYWREMVADCMEKSGEVPDLAALFAFHDRYLFCSTGNISVYEYSYREKRVKRWQSFWERKRADRELGVPEGENQNLYFKCRKISEGSLFLIVPEQIHVENPEISKKRDVLDRMAQNAAHLAGAAIVIKCGEG